jgi:hypothetical protein
MRTTGAAAVTAPTAPASIGYGPASGFSAAGRTAATGSVGPEGDAVPLMSVILPSTPANSVFAIVAADGGGSVSRSLLEGGMLSTSSPRTGTLSAVVARTGGMLSTSLPITGTLSGGGSEGGNDSMSVLGGNSLSA